MIYIDNTSLFESNIQKKNLENKKTLFTFGDSWTNNTYLNRPGFDTYPQKSWPYQLAEKLGYDVVVNMSWQGGSNTEIFESCLQLMSLNEDYEFDKCKIKELGCSEIKCIVGWSSQIRDFSPMHKIFRPFNATNIPYVHVGDEHNRDKQLSKVYFKFIDKIMKIEYYQYITQVQTILLQEYFKNHKIDFYSFMAFTPLVENEFKNTDWDLREHIDGKTFYGLYSDTDSMAQKLNNLIGSDIKNEFIVDQPHYDNKNFIKIFTDFFNKKKEYKEFLEKQHINKLNSKYHLKDGHPNELGLEVISDELFKLITNS